MYIYIDLQTGCILLKQLNPEGARALDCILKVDKTKRNKSHSHGKLKGLGAKELTWYAMEKSCVNAV